MLKEIFQPHLCDVIDRRILSIPRRIELNDLTHLLVEGRSLTSETGNEQTLSFYRAIGGIRHDKEYFRGKTESAKYKGVLDNHDGFVGGIHTHTDVNESDQEGFSPNDWASFLSIDRQRFDISVPQNEGTSYLLLKTTDTPRSP